MSSYQIIRQITLGTAGYACTVMAIRKDTAGTNEIRIRLCSSLPEAERASRILEDELSDRVVARGGAVVREREPAGAHY
jgi:hypothetical protein